MNFNAYQKKAFATAKYPSIGNNPYYPTLGLCGEAGEVAEKIKKVMRDDGGFFSIEKLVEIEKELGDVMWYVAAVATELGLTMETIAEKNIAKLASRKKRGLISRSGDNR